MAYNIAEVGVDRKTGAPILDIKTKFNYLNDPEGTNDIFYYLGKRMGSSQYINPVDTEFLSCTKLLNLQTSGSSPEAVDNSPNTNVLTNSTDENDGVEIRFIKREFVLEQIQINSDNSQWKLEGSPDGNNWTLLTLGASTILGNNWSLYTVPNAGGNKFYRVLNGEQGVSKSLHCLKFFGRYLSSDMSCTKEDKLKILTNKYEEDGVIYLPDAAQENYDENYHVRFICLKNVEYQFAVFNNSTVQINDFTNQKLTRGEQLLAIYFQNTWNLYKVGREVDLVTKAQLLSHNGTKFTILDPGDEGQILTRDNSTDTGLKWENLSLNSQQFSPQQINSFTLSNSYNNKLVPINTDNGSITVTLDTNLPPGYQVILYHSGSGEITIDSNGQQYKGRGTKILNNNAAVTLAYDSTSQTWYAIGDLV